MIKFFDILERKGKEKFRPYEFDIRHKSNKKKKFFKKKEKVAGLLLFDDLTADIFVDIKRVL